MGSKPTGGYRPQAQGGMSYDVPNQMRQQQAADWAVSSGAAPASAVGRFGPGYTDATMNNAPNLAQTRDMMAASNARQAQERQLQALGPQTGRGFAGAGMFGAPRINFTFGAPQGNLTSAPVNPDMGAVQPNPFEWWRR